MVSFKPTVITNKGKILLNKIIAGKSQMEFTNLRTSGDDVLENELMNLIDLDDQKQITDIDTVEVDENNKLKVKGIFSNLHLSKGYFTKLIGLYATDPDDGEILFSVTKVLDSDFMPPYNGVSESKITVTILTSLNKLDSLTVNLNMNNLAKKSDFSTLKQRITNIDGTLEDHKEELLDSEFGEHGFRVVDGNLEIWNGLEWVDLDEAGGSNPPDNVTGLSLEVSDSELILRWSDPANSGSSVWDGTILVRKMGAFPKGVNDGNILLDSKIRDQYKIEGFIDRVLENGQTYYYQLFPYSTDKGINKDEGNRITGTPLEFKVFGVRIDTVNSNPLSSVIYTKDAKNMTPGSSTWDSQVIFKDIKPCVFKNGTVQYYLKPNDFTKKLDDSNADITSGSAGDVMIEIPKIGYRIKTNGNFLDVEITNKPNDSNFSYHAFSRNTEGDKDKLYIGAYLGYLDNGKLRSLSGKTPTNNKKIGEFRGYAQELGSGYDILSFYPLTLLQCLYLIKYKNLDSQTALGRGYVDGNSNIINTGGTNKKGMYYGENTGKLQMKFAGIEDFWGNLLCWIDGLYSDSSRNIMTAYKNFNDTASGYVNRGLGSSSNVFGYMSLSQGNELKGFIIKEGIGSETQYFCDYSYLSNDKFPVFGGYWTNASNAGVFQLLILGSVDSSNNYNGARLMYL